jgi:hypothetical protein
MVAIELAVDADGLVGFALARQFPGLAQLAAFALGARHGRDFGNVRVAGMLAAQTAQRLVGLVCRSHEFVVPCEAGQGFSIIGFREQNLLPQLNGHVGPSARFKGTGFIYEGGSGRCGRTSRRLILGETQLERQKQATQTNRKPHPSPAAVVHLRFHSTFSSPPGPNWITPSRNPMANKARF